jgi:hypothetical protein
MPCQTSATCAIVIPTGTPGATGAAGAAGAPGAAILKNTTGTDYTAGAGDASLVSYPLSANTVAVGDILDITALFYITTFVGTIYTKFGTATLVGHAGEAAGIDAPDPVGGYTVVELKAKIHIKTLATEDVLSEKLIYGNPTTQINTPIASIGENTANAVTIDVRANKTSGTAICKSFTVIHSKKI